MWWNLKKVKNLLLYLYQEVRIRRNLCALHDRRYAMPLLDPGLREAAATWPEVLPWKWKPRTVLDVGAYKGQVAMQLAQLYRPNFIGLIEPQQELAVELQSKSFAPHQKVFACALGRSAGSSTLNVLASAASSSLLSITPGCEKLFHRRMDVKRLIQVPVRTLDSIFAECGLQELDLLKIDVQGYELEVLTGAEKSLRNIHVIVSEVSFFEHYHRQPLFPEVYAYLVAMGFAMRGTFGYLYDDRGRPLQCDAVFINLSRP